MRSDEDSAQDKADQGGLPQAMQARSRQQTCQQGDNNGNQV